MTAVLDRREARSAPPPELDPPALDPAEAEGEWDLLAAGAGCMAAPPTDPITAIRIPFDPGRWPLFKWIDARKGLGYTRENWEQAVQETPELVQIAAAWLHLRDLPEYAGITPREVGERVMATQFDGPADPKATRRS